MLAHNHQAFALTNPLREPFVVGKLRSIVASRLVVVGGIDEPRCRTIDMLDRELVRALHDGPVTNRGPLLLKSTTNQRSPKLVRILARPGPVAVRLGRRSQTSAKPKADETLRSVGNLQLIDVLTYLEIGKILDRDIGMDEKLPCGSNSLILLDENNLLFTMVRRIARCACEGFHHNVVLGLRIPTVDAKLASKVPEERTNT